VKSINQNFIQFAQQTHSLAKEVFYRSGVFEISQPMSSSKSTPLSRNPAGTMMALACKAASEFFLYF
jgi:hypothetical protein